MGVFSDISSQLSIQAAEFENEQLAALLVSNPVMSDGNALFSAPHNNLAAAGTVIDSAGLSAGRLAMRMQTNANGQPIAVAPRYLLTSAGKETEAEKALASIFPPTTADANTFTGAFGLVVDPRLDHLSQALPWYLFGDVAIAPVLEFSYSQRIRRAARIHSRWVPGRIGYRRYRGALPVGLRLRRYRLAGRV